MSSTDLATVLVLASVFLSGCVAKPYPLQIGVTDDGFSVGDRALKSRSELADAIRVSGATECRVTPAASTTYKQVETAMLAVHDAGCRSGIVGNMQP